MKLQNQGKKEYIVLINGSATEPLTFKQMYECTTYHQRINKIIAKDIETDKDCPSKLTRVGVIKIKKGAK